MPNHLVPCVECVVRYPTEATLRVHLSLAHPILPPSSRRRLSLTCSVDPTGGLLG